MEHSSRHTVIFTTILCVVFSFVVSTVSVALKDRQAENKRLAKIKNVLAVAGLIQPGEVLSREELSQRFETKLEPHLVEIETGAYVDDEDPMAYDQRKASADPARSTAAPENKAKVRRIPNHAQIFLLREDPGEGPGEYLGEDPGGDRAEGGEIIGIILPIEGYGLWSTLYGFVALEPDATTIRGITYYRHGETAGLGGEVDNPRWKALWPGRLVYDDSGEVAIRVKKGRAGPVDKDPYQVDGLSGATLTSNGVTNMLHFWLGANGFATYLDRYHSNASKGKEGI